MRSKAPLQLAYQVKLDSHSTALKAEGRVKKLSKQKKEGIVAAKPTGQELLKFLGIKV